MLLVVQRRVSGIGWRKAVTVGVVVGAMLAVGGSAATPYVQPLLLGGIASDPVAPGGIKILPASPHGRVTLPSLDTAQAQWLASGIVPGITPDQHAMAARALLDIRLLLRPDGAVAAAWYPGWKYAWPRDSSWVAAALAATELHAPAFTVLRFLARVQLPSGTWAARYQLSGDSPVRDGRPVELDSNGWFPWAVWFWYATQPNSPAIKRGLISLWPAVRRAANKTVSLLGRNGLPPPAMDYWEDSSSLVTLSTAAPLLAGLRSAADIAHALGHGADAERWTAAGRRLSHGIRANFGHTGYQRTPEQSSGADVAVTFLGPPFFASNPAVRQAVTSAVRILTLPNGGIIPGSAWHGDPGGAWTPETGFFALYDASSGDWAGAQHWLNWLVAHRTAFGSLPEQVNSAGRPASVAPLAWTDAITLLTMVAQQRRLPMP